MLFDVKNEWKNVLEDFINSDLFKELSSFLEKEYLAKIIFPKKENIFRALKLTDYDEVKVVILGQDPYFNINEADGLAFSCSQTNKMPPSLKNIFKELYDDLGIVKMGGDLSSWAKEGVLLLNTVLTVESGKPNSHSNKGWEKFTDEIIKKINDKETPVVFILWGSNAINKERLITKKNHLVIKSVHPSPLSAYRGFFGSKPFTKANLFLKTNKITPINWN